MNKQDELMQKKLREQFEVDLQKMFIELKIDSVSADIIEKSKVILFDMYIRGFIHGQNIAKELYESIANELKKQQKNTKKK